MKKVMLSMAVGAMVLGGAVLAKEPVRNVGHRHPNLAAAQRLIDQAFEKVTAAQKANEYDMSGHAAKAKELLDQANKEIKLAAQEANEHAAR